MLRTALPVSAPKEAFVSFLSFNFCFVLLFSLPLKLYLKIVSAVLGVGQTDDLVSSYTKSDRVLMYLSLI